MTFIDFENYKNNRYDHQVKSEDFDNDHAIDKMTAVSLRYELVSESGRASSSYSSVFDSSVLCIQSPRRRSARSSETSYSP